MAFWSGDTLLKRLSALVDPADPNCIDCAAYTLKVGPEYYVTPTDRSPDPKSISLRTLQSGEAFAIPPGQFAYVLTEEVVTVPKGALAFISIRARVKWKGLVNVSGFHVDPGFSGRLTFSVFNAGPVPIHLRQGDPTFLIWFADLDHESATYTKTQKVSATRMDIGVLSQVAGEVYSLQGLAERARAVEKELSARIAALERANGIVYVAAGVIITLVLGLSAQWIVKQLAAPSSAPASLARPSHHHRRDCLRRAYRSVSVTAIPFGVGIDLIDLDRFRLLYGHDDPELLSRCFTDDELIAVGSGPDRIARLAGRFAAKEAAYKALGGVADAALTDIAVESDSSGAPHLILRGAAKTAAEQRGICALLVSLTHSDLSAAAVVIALSAGPI